MEIVNGARHTVADITTVMDKTGREHLVIVVKATYRIPANSKTPRPVIPPQPLMTNDIFVGEPGFSAPLYEVDFVRHKPKCDVLFNATAYPSQDEPVSAIDVSVQVGALHKHIHVVGDRLWDKNHSQSTSEPEPFTQIPLNFERAFGGIHYYLNGEEEIPDAFEHNLVGTGYNTHSSLDDGIALPNLEVPGKPITHPESCYEPIALSAIARNWLPRRKFAGTYDEHWQKNVFPFLPDDFDESYFQCAPPDQQISYPKGGEDVILRNLMKGREEVRFKLPRFDNLPIKILSADYKIHQPLVVVDTLYFEPDENRFSVVWRTSLPIKSKLQEYQTIAIGHVCKDWWDAKIVGSASCSDCLKDLDESEVNL